MLGKRWGEIFYDDDAREYTIFLREFEDVVVDNKVHGGVSDNGTGEVSGGEVEEGANFFVFE